MTAALARAARNLEIPPTKGVSSRAARDVLARMAQLSREDGSMRFGMSIAKTAELTGYKPRTVVRARNYLASLGLIVQDTRGGGSRASHWRVTLPPEALSTGTPGHSLQAVKAQPLGHRGTGQDHRQGLSMGMTPLDLDLAVCEEHGSDGGVLPNGQPRCPMCRRSNRRATA